MEKNTAAPALSIYEIQRNAAESAISEELEQLGLISRPVDDGPDMTDVSIPAGDANGDAYEQVCAAWHREPCGDTKAALSHAILAMRPIFDASLGDDIGIMQAANLYLQEPAEEGVWAGDIHGIIRFAQTFMARSSQELMEVAEACVAQRCTIAMEDWLESQPSPAVKSAEPDYRDLYEKCKREKAAAYERLAKYEDVKMVKSAEPTEQQAEQTRRLRVGEAVAHWNLKWPVEITSDTMYFNGLRITRAEFDAVVDRVLGAEPTGGAA